MTWWVRTLSATMKGSSWEMLLALLMVRWSEQLSLVPRRVFLMGLPTESQTAATLVGPLGRPLCASAVSNPNTPTYHYTPVGADEGSVVDPLADGEAVVGRMLGSLDGTAVVGASVGAPDGSGDGSLVGAADVGAADGAEDGSEDGALVGTADGSAVGAEDGALVGDADGSAVGAVDGSEDGTLVGYADG
jgi:hypothetical protein